MRGPIQSIEITYIIHATEDSDRVSSAISDLLGTTMTPDLERLEGHFGNEIIRAKFHLIGEDASRAFSTAISKMPPSLKKEIVDDVHSFLDEHSSLFLRLSKQRLVLGSMELGPEDSVRIKVKPRAFIAKGRAAQFYAELIRGQKHV